MHFTYSAPVKTQLMQGDVISRSEEVEKLLKEIHPHYHGSNDYKYFIVLTQTCDLVRRNVGGACKSRYISLAAVRPLQTALRRALETFQYTEVERKLGFAPDSAKTKLEQFMVRLLNNNEPDYFFLFREPLRGLTEDHCAFLQLSVSLRGDLHYDTLLDAKVLQLQESFQHKLGWLVGNIYSRVGTEDWLPDQCTPDVFLRHARAPAENEGLVLWLEQDVYSKVLKTLKNAPPGEWTEERLKAEVKTATQTKASRRAQALERVSQALSHLGLAEGQIDGVVLRLENDPEFRSHIK
jgi:hypothetical protein